MGVREKRETEWEKANSEFDPRFWDYFGAGCGKNPPSTGRQNQYTYWFLISILSYIKHNI